MCLKIFATWVLRCDVKEVSSELPLKWQYGGLHLLFLTISVFLFQQQRLRACPKNYTFVIYKGSVFFEKVKFEGEVPFKGVLLQLRMPYVLVTSF